MILSRPFTLALLSASLVTAVAWFAVPGAGGWPGAAILFGSVFFVVWLVLRAFVFRRIRSIYQTLYASYPEAHASTRLPRRENILVATEEEAALWVKRRQEEIEQLKRMEAHRKEFLGNVSHELKTPIFNIQGYISTLLDGGLEDRSIHYDYLKRSEHNVERLIQIVEDLVDISQLETGELKLDREAFDIIALLREVVEVQEFNAGSRGISLRLLNETDKPVMVYADKYRIRQVLTNLVVNSIRYGKDNGSTTLKATVADGRASVEIADTGIGIAPEHMNRIFERFYRADKSRSRELGGTGLGLSIVKHIIEAHGQAIRVASEVGKGTVFTFTLPQPRPGTVL